MERPAWKARIHEVIFEADTPSGRVFDLGLMIAIVASIVAVMLESVESFDAEFHEALWAFELAVTAIFTIEYALRIISVDKPWRYVLSFYGIVDLMSIVPFYVSLAFPGVQSLLVIRALRLLRVFRVLKLGHFLDEASVLGKALAASRRKIMVFLGAVLTVVIIMGSAMYVIEGADSGFTSIPRGIYWAIVTMTTVGYGDIAPQTVAGQSLASVVMILGYGIIAVPTGIVSVELAEAYRKDDVTTRHCPSCLAHGHDNDAKHCKFCGTVI
jgi:voltage-gated potassium channel